LEVTQAGPVLLDDGLVAVGPGPGLVVSVGELASVGEGDELVVAEAGEGDDDRQRQWPWWCLQVASAAEEEVCMVGAMGAMGAMGAVEAVTAAQPVSRAAAITARAGIAFIGLRP
jgi:hypothetical protein